MRAYLRAMPLALAVPVTLMLLASALLLSACNTTAGLGKDVSATGDAVTDSADKVKQSMP